jgi:hypothetical protein
VDHSGMADCQLTIDRMTRLMDYSIKRFSPQARSVLSSWLFLWGGFIMLMLAFVNPTPDQSMTLLSLLICVLLFISERDHRYALLSFAAGSGLGYFLELWGTTRECWTYYTYQMPPLFAVLAHGMAAVAFWRANQLVLGVFHKLTKRRS